MEPFEVIYFNWLCAKVLDVNTRNYYSLMQILHSTEFVWVVPFDRHRSADGVELREYFLREADAACDDLWMEQPCSIFEMLIAFAKRASFQTDMPTREWFMIFIDNLQLDPFRVVHDSDIPIIEDILQIFMWRTYEPSGHGGLFPLSRTSNDQREIEIWYQWCEYVEEHELI